MTKKVIKKIEATDKISDSRVIINKNFETLRKRLETVEKKLEKLLDKE